MGRRELVIILGFIVAGALAYRFTAPPAAAGQGFSFSRILDGIRRGTNPASAEVVNAGTIPAGPNLQTLRLNAIRKVEVVGESRTDIAYELTVRSDGPDQASALDYAKKTTLRSDDLGESVTLGVRYPEEATQTASLVLRVPSRLRLRVAGRSDAKVTNVAALHLDDASGATAINDVAGDVTGFHRNGPLTVEGVDRLDLSLRGSRATITGGRQGGRITLSGGELTLEGVKGAIEISTQNSEVLVRGNAGPLQINGSGGEIRLERPRAEVRVDVRRASVEMTIDPDAIVPATLLTVEERLEVVLGEADAVTIDAVASRGAIQSEEFGLTAERADDTARLTHAFGGRDATPRVSSARVVLRNERGDIVLSKRK